MCKTSCTPKIRRSSRVARGLPTPWGRRCAALIAAERGELTLRAFYHSHPDHDAYFSAEDRTQPWAVGTNRITRRRCRSSPVCNGQVCATKAFAWDPAARDFVEVALVVPVTKESLRTAGRKLTTAESARGRCESALKGRYAKREHKLGFTLFPWEQQLIAVNGRRMAYIDEGPRGGRPVLLLSGNPTWGFLYRDFIAPLTEAGYRAIAPDWIGAGFSDHPHIDAALSFAHHIADLVSLMDQLDLRGFVIVGQDWGGPQGVGAALQRLEPSRRWC